MKSQRKLLQAKYPLEDSWLFTNKPTEEMLPFGKNPSEKSFVVESFDKESGRADCQLTFMNPSMFRKQKIAEIKPHNLSIFSQITDATDLQSHSMLRQLNKKKSNVIRMLDKSRKQKDEYMKRILSISVDHKKSRNANSSTKKEQLYRRSESKLPRARTKSTLKSCCCIDTPRHTIQTPKSKQTLTSTNK